MDEPENGRIVAWFRDGEVTRVPVVVMVRLDHIQEDEDHRWFVADCVNSSNTAASKSYSWGECQDIFNKYGEAEILYRGKEVGRV